ncbi:SIR2 family protein [Chryseobacterium sp. BIGb0232]|uniref:SIR2 family NAD-dependent protein deacylase n=1 Tax=Chryseobacterium sp. BIGb0232 TaxID=2940598 RepID=UPI000F47606C|nr:SIR2 family protein [Chryseobacterium sp. BIGb0232]MCS4305430.1 hypothetical protein [Chryseobacterium sp. BIGb0232]ROS07102.1 SIR2-like protein [Chryseobacterium nakagawai]
MIDNLPSDIQSYFDEIAERLWTGHASIMVGAGFSKNAINTINPLKQPPGWWELGDTFYEKIHGNKPSNDVKYASLLKLAEEYEAAFGRSALEHFIAKIIADSEYEPSDLHKILMELPWTDVLTTNYDTLLERSCKDVISRRYDIVVNKNDLAHSNKPRIIKLHGSLPSERPFIITEEDYRSYPRKFAPFVNTVQQSLLENTLCLIGFSGDDPNFLQWIGWINDNIGKDNASKIYLIGILNLSESQKKLLNNKNIISVDLSGYKDLKGNHQKGLKVFINYLACQKYKRENLNWPLQSDLKTPNSTDKIDFITLIQEWRNCRKKYPNWLILPQTQREKLWMFTELHSKNTGVFDNLKKFDDLEYIYELNWRLEKCLFPIWNNMSSYFQKILDRYNFFPENISENREINILNTKLNHADRDKYKNFWIQLSLSLLRFYREENFVEKWETTYRLLNSIKQHLSSDQLSLFYYEQILEAIFKLKLNEAKKILDEWPQNNISVFWNIKRAMLLSEFGQSKEAVKLLEANLLEIRRKLNLSPIEDDYTWVSLESYVMYQLKFLQGNIQLEENEVNSKAKSEDYNERWNDLRQYNCDPWGEQKYFDLMLQKPYYPENSTSINSNFEIGQATRSYTFGTTSEDFIIAYTFLRFIEELAIPLSLSRLNFSDKTINGVLKRIKLISPQWGIAILNRSRDEKVVDTVFDRVQMLKFSSSIIDAYTNECIRRFHELLPEEESNPIARAFIRKVPYLLSRLCTKCNDSIKLDIYKLCYKLYTQELDLPKTDNLIKNLINSSSKDLLNKAIGILLEFPLLNSESVISYTLIEPFNFIKTSNISSTKVKLKKEVFNFLIENTKKEKCRKDAIKRLIFLYNSEQLNKVQSQKLFNTIWSETDELSGFPKNTTFYNFAFINFLQPKGIDAEIIYKKYINENNFNVQGLQTKAGIGISKGEDRYFEELIYGSRTINKNSGVIWSIEELEKILSKCEIWWKFDKYYILDEKYKEEGFGTSIQAEFTSRFDNLINIISRVLGFYRNDLSEDMLHRIKKISYDLEKSNMSVLTLKIVFGFFNTYEEYFVELQKGLLSNNRKTLLDALNSVILAIHSSSYASDTIFINRLLDILLVPLQWRMLDLMGDIFDVFNDYINHTTIVSDSVKKELYDSLQYILDLSIDDKINIDDFLLLKQKSIVLASSIYKKKLENNVTIPPIISAWKDVSENKEEFADIRNKW